MVTAERGCLLSCPKSEVEEAAVFHAGLLHVSASHCEFSSILLWKKTQCCSSLKSGVRGEPPLRCIPGVMGCHTFPSQGQRNLRRHLKRLFSPECCDVWSGLSVPQGVFWDVWGCHSQGRLLDWSSVTWVTLKESLVVTIIPLR